VKKRVQVLLEAAHQPGAIISRWESEFFDSVMKQLERGRTLSPAQVAIIDKAEAKVKKFKEGDVEWESQWSGEKLWAWNVAVDYYNSTPERYFGLILDWAIANPSLIPPQHFYKKLVENKYAQKIIKGLSTDPKYPAGSAVMLRANARQALPYSEYYDFNNKLLFVIDPTNRAVTPAKGCRIYSILSSDSAKTFEVEERFIKKYKKIKQQTIDDDYVPF